MQLRGAALPTVGLLAGLAVACGGAGNSGSSDGTEACHKIIDACHLKDDGTDPAINGCHGLAHEYSPECEDQLEYCVGLCNAAPDLTGGDYSTGTQGGDTSTGTTSAGGSSTSGSATSG